MVGVWQMWWLISIDQNTCWWKQNVYNSILIPGILLWYSVGLAKEGCVE